MKKAVEGILIIVIIAAAGAAAAFGPVRLHKAREEADAFAAETGIEVKYEDITDISSKEAFLTEIWQIAQWEENTRTEINDAFGYTDKEYAPREIGVKTGYENEEELYVFAIKEKWVEFRGDLDKSVRNAIEELFEKSDSTYDLNKRSVELCYEKNTFGKINEVMRSVEDGAGMEAYDLARKGLKEDWSALPMDIAYGLRPKLILAGCEAALLSAIKTNDLYDVRSAVSSAEEFSSRYHVTIDGLQKARKKEETLEYANKPDIPSVGMSVSKARLTKLGPPTRTTTDKGSWSHKEHTYGDMYWDKDGKQIFKVHYFDGEITDVYDTRNSTAKSPWVSSRKSSSKPRFDPDDHDIEAYYEDNRDEYDDYDDAYDGFLDDEGAWDDY